MAYWEVIRTDTFLRDLKKLRKINELLVELDKKILKLKGEPISVGKELHGELHLSRSTRLYKKYRLIFQINNTERKVYLEAIDHRKDIY
ncbi:MAG TPA: type II toxin-antitoxin system RelE/ParE family toxin [Candidatus Nanoarchaeia archaeon]|nr:type II toxin-antitoxin system RelE/ParE family toxin [Candidatus Nanoarchaeia archaeon]